MNGKSLVVILIAWLVAVAPVWAAPSVQVAVLPFAINAQDDLSYMADEIPRVIESHLKKEGAQILDAKAAPAAAANRSPTAQEARQVGIGAGADYVIWGSLTWIGQKFSMDAQMIASFIDDPEQTFSVQGEGIEHMLGAVNQLAVDIGLKLFQREKVAQVRIAGNDRIETDAIERVIQTRPGDVYLAKSLSADLKAIYAMGYFEDIRIEAVDSPKGKIITFNLKEKPTIRMIRIKGNHVYSEEEIKENMTISTGSILNIFKIQNNIRRIEELYKEKNYHNVKINYETEPLEHNQADLNFIIDEGEKVRIKSITFQGNSHYSTDELKDLMKTNEKGFFSWLTDSGDFDSEDLNQDVAKIAAFYQNSGYVRAKVGEPQITFEGDWIYITIKIEEGPRFKVGTVSLEGDLIESADKLLEKLKISGQEYFSRKVLRDDILVLTDFYSDQGYAYVEVLPNIRENDQDLIVDIVYQIDKGSKVYFEKIIITGNTKTRDKVIRRELAVYEQGLYSGKGLKRGVRNLYRLDFFEDIKVNTTRGSDDDKMILSIDVKEKPTGTFSFGGGYSSVENLFFTAAITQRNLFGRAQVLQLSASIGGRTDEYVLSFTEPWLFDIPLSAGADLYNRSRDYDSYDLDTIGARPRFSYPIWDFTRAYLTYTYEMNNMRNISSEYLDFYQNVSGKKYLSGLTGSVQYDSRDQVFSPTEGQDHTVMIQHTGGLLGGDIGFTKYTAEAGFYVPLFWGTTGFIHGRGGYVNKNSDGILPYYDRFYLGGINTVRGYTWREISPTVTNLETGSTIEIGGQSFVQYNLEYIFPLLKDVGLMGVLFYDGGGVYGTSDIEGDFDETKYRIDDNSSGIRQGVGVGFRWYSPMGPIRLEYGYALDPVTGGSSGGRWEFAMGTAF